MAILKFIIYSNILVSSSSGILAFACSYQLGNKHFYGIGWVVFFSTLFIYNIQRIIRIKEPKIQKSERHIWIEKNQNLIIFFSMIGLISSILIYFIVLKWGIDFWVLSFGAILGLAYVLSPHPKLSALRDIPYIKIYIIGIQWSVAAVFWPYFRQSEAIEFPTLLFGSVFFYILTATIPFDIRDIVNDNKNKYTIPQIFGQAGAKSIGIGFIIISAVCLLFYSHSINHLLFGLAFTGLIILLILSHPKRHEMYYSGIIDGWIIFYAWTIYSIG